MSNTAVFPKTIPLHASQGVTKPTSGRTGVVNISSGPGSPFRAASVKSESAQEETAASESAIRQQLTRMLRSSVFIQSEKLSRFLRFIVEHALNGNQNYLKEYVIGSEVYDRRPPYHPSLDSIVRTEARRLRSKLKGYYETEGKDDSLYIYLRPGSYIPVFQTKAALAGAQNPADVPRPAGSANSPAVAILPFTDISGTLLSAKCACGIPDELAYTLLRNHACRVICPSSTAHLSAPEQGAAAAMRKLGAQIAFEGSVREEENHIRVNARMVDAAGFQLWATRLDADATAQTMFVIEEQIAAALSAGYNALFGGSPRFHS